MLTELWICLFLPYSGTDFPASVQYHFLGSLYCFHVVGKTVFSHIHWALPNASGETMVLFILRDYAYTSRERGGSEFLAMGWNIPQLPPVSIWGTTRACTSFPSSCPVLYWKVASAAKGNQTSHRLLDQVPRSVREGCSQNVCSHNFSPSLEIWVPKPSCSLWIQC